MQRRELLRVLGATTALSLLKAPHEAAAAWARVVSGATIANGLSEAHLALVGAIADVIIPRTDTPSATDVKVPAFVDVMVSENYADAERASFVAGLDAIDAHIKSNGGLPVDGAGKSSAIESLEALSDRRSEPARTYWRLKDLVIYGYFTSEPVSKNVLKNEVMPGKFEGAAPMPKKSMQPAGSGAHHG